MKKYDVSTNELIAATIILTIFIGSFLSFMAIVASWIPPVAGIIMELSVILFVLVMSLVLSAAVTFAAVVIVGFMVGVTQEAGRARMKTTASTSKEE